MESQNKIRENIILKIKDKYHITKFEQELTTMRYFIEEGDQNIYIEHSFSKWIKVYTDEIYNYISFNSLEDDCLEKIIDHIDSLIKDIKI